MRLNGSPMRETWTFRDGGGWPEIVRIFAVRRTEWLPGRERLALLGSAELDVAHDCGGGARDEHHDQQDDAGDHRDELAPAGQVGVRVGEEGRGRQRSPLPGPGCPMRRSGHRAALMGPGDRHRRRGRHGRRRPPGDRHMRGNRRRVHRSRALLGHARRDRGWRRSVRGRWLERWGARWAAGGHAGRAAGGQSRGPPCRCANRWRRRPGYRRTGRPPRGLRRRPRCRRFDRPGRRRGGWPPRRVAGRPTRRGGFDARVVDHDMRGAAVAMPEEGPARPDADENAEMDPHQPGEREGELAAGPEACHWAPTRLATAVRGCGVVASGPV